jgi:hypothetical protein
MVATALATQKPTTTGMTKEYIHQGFLIHRGYNYLQVQTSLHLQVDSE